MFINLFTCLICYLRKLREEMTAGGYICNDCDKKEVEL